MAIVEIFREIIKRDEIIVAPAIASHEWGFVLLADCLARSIEADQLQPKVVLLHLVVGAYCWVRSLYYKEGTLRSYKKRERLLGDCPLPFG